MIFKKFPFPPTVNSIYPSARNGRRFKSAKYVEYMNECRIWQLKNNSLLLEARSILGDLVKDPNVFLKLDIDLMLSHSDLYTKKGTNKKIDCTNRIKPLLDVLSGMIRIDDSRFFLGKVEFVISKQKGVCIAFDSANIRKVLEN